MYQIGLTGGIASGKSTVSRMLSELGAPIIDADAIARTVVAPDQPAWQNIIDCFGGQILYPDGSIDRRKLGDIVFDNPEKRKQLEAITHPAIWQQIKAEIAKAEAAGARIIVLDVPLLLETDWDSKVDAVWVVYVDHLTQIKRLMTRNGLTRQQAELRINAQLSLEEKRKRADVIIDNSDSLESTQQQVEALWKKLRADE